MTTKERFPHAGDILTSLSGREQFPAKIKSVLRQTDDGRFTVLYGDRYMTWTWFDPDEGWVVQ